MSRSRLVVVLIATIATIAASAVLGGVAVALSTPSKVSACTTKGHAVRVLGTKVKCRKGEKKLTWRMRGQQGVAGPHGVRGPKGDAGPQGPAGVRGPAGSLGTVRTVIGTATVQSPTEGVEYAASAWCKASEQAVGGGFMLTDADQRDIALATIPVFGPTGLQGWQARIMSRSPIDASYGVNAYVLCVPA